MLTTLLAVALIAGAPATPQTIDVRTTPVLEGKTGGTYVVSYRGTLNWPWRSGLMPPDPDGYLRRKEAEVGDWVHIFTQGYFDEYVQILKITSDGAIFTERASYHQDRWAAWVRWELVKGDPPGTIRTTNGAWVWPNATFTVKNCKDVTIVADIADVPGVALKIEGSDDVTVRDSKFRNWANVRNGLFGAIVVEMSADVRIQRTTFKDSNGIAVMPRTGKRVTIEDSVFENVCRALVDTAAIHAEGRLWEYDDLVVKNCTFDGIGHPDAPQGVTSRDIVAGVYPDDGRQKTRVENCVFRNVKIGVFVHGGSYVTVHRCDFAPSVDFSIDVAKAPVDWVRSWNAKPENALFRPIPETPRNLTFYLNRDRSKNGRKLSPGVSASVTEVEAS